MVIVLDSIFEAGRRASWLDSANDASLNQRCQAVVYGLM